MILMYCFCSSGEYPPPSNTSENPTIALSGVRISWLMFARKDDFKRLASSAASLATRNSCSETSRESFNFLVRRKNQRGEGKNGQRGYLCWSDNVRGLVVKR